MTGVAIVGRSDKAGGFADHVREGFERNGVPAQVFQVRSRFEPRRGKLANAAWTARGHISKRWEGPTRLLNEDVSRGLKAFSPDLVLSLLPLTGKFEVELWRKAAPNAMVALWSPDCLNNFGDQRAFGAGFDRLYTKDPYLVDRLHAGGMAEARYLAEGAPVECVDWAARQPDVTRQNWLAMVGNIYPSRVRFLQDLGSRSDLKIFGRVTANELPTDLQRMFTGEYLWREEKYQVFREARCVVNNLHYAEVGSMNYRLFEAAGAGGVVATDNVPQVKRYLEPGREVITFSSAEDLAKQLDELTLDELNAIANAAQDRIARDHRMEFRLEEMLEDCGLGN